MQKLVLASGNRGKLKEFSDLLHNRGFDVCAQSEFNLDSADETGLTFVENAILKARHVCLHTGLPALADDSGIEVDALKGEPGIYSARFAGPEASDANNNQKLLRELAAVEDEFRTARYHCVLVLMRHAQDPTPLICQGAWEGRILRESIGEGGFGYDPLFFVPTHNCSAAQLDKAEKNRISHRAIALQTLLRSLAQFPFAK
ncbi:MAG: RdgB/HAM1 family non-canonical purine NTP pyrophosphatase [Cellvibrionaceae bacterium]|nr:RdgB/HAM1 family non-canonical purine NTP pyrophosphatase [Cellvibrionaceae bacterium]